MYKNWLLSGQKHLFGVYLVLVFGRIVIFLCDDLMKTIKKGLGIVLYERYAKRVIDLVLGIVILVVLSPVFLILMILIKLDSRGPVFFRQKRVGRDKEYFSILKFRTMRTDAPKDMPTHLLQNPDAFITRVGKFLRKTSLDELPQFWNVLKGDMSLVGTRPPTLDEYESYTPEQKRRLSFKPGTTGLWQVSGRSEITDFDEVVKLDVVYMDGWTIWRDIKILLKTIKVVVMKE